MLFRSTLKEQKTEFEERFKGLRAEIAQLKQARADFEVQITDFKKVTEEGFLKTGREYAAFLEEHEKFKKQAEAFQKHLEDEAQMQNNHASWKEKAIFLAKALALTCSVIAGATTLGIPASATAAITATGSAATAMYKALVGKESDMKEEETTAELKSNKEAT